MAYGANTKTNYDNGVVDWYVYQTNHELAHVTPNAAKVAYIKAYLSNKFEATYAESVFMLKEYERLLKEYPEYFV